MASTRKVVSEFLQLTADYEVVLVGVFDEVRHLGTRLDSFKQELSSIEKDSKHSQDRLIEALDMVQNNDSFLAVLTNQLELVAIRTSRLDRKVKNLILLMTANVITSSAVLAAWLFI